jgi:hypothetical protein
MVFSILLLARLKGDRLHQRRGWVNQWLDVPEQGIYFLRRKFPLLR